MNKRQGFAPILLIVLALVISVGGVGIGLAWKTNILDKILPPNIKELFGRGAGPTDGTPTNGEEPTNEENGEPTAEDPTKDWKSYTSEDLKITFRYPPGWYITPKSGERRISITSYDLQERLKIEPLYPTRLGELMVQLTLSATDKPTNKTVREWAIELCADDHCVVEEETITLGSKEWIGVSNGDPSLLISSGTKVYSLFITGLEADAPQAWEQLELFISTLGFQE